MTSRKSASNSNVNETPTPPAIAINLLSFFLPATLREPIIGDLEEEFTYRFFSGSKAFAIYRWYWRQVLRSSCHYFWKQRGTGMAYLISVIIFAFLFTLAVATGGYGLWYLLPPPLLATIPASLLLGIGATSAKAAKTAFRLSFSDAAEHTSSEVSLAKRFLSVTGNQFLLVAGAVFIMSSIQWFFSFSQNPELLTEPSHYSSFGFAILPLFYGMIFKCLFYSAEQKLAWKYASD